MEWLSSESLRESCSFYLLLGRRRIVGGPRRIRLGPPRAPLDIQLHRTARASLAITPFRPGIHGAGTGLAGPAIGILLMIVFCVRYITARFGTRIGA